MNVLYFNDHDEDDKDRRRDHTEEMFISPLYVSPHRDRKHHVNLIVIDDGEQSHYLLVTKLSALVAHRTSHTGMDHVCPYCLSCQYTNDALKKHLELCKQHMPQTVTYPQAPNNILQFDKYFKCHKVPFVLYCDFESLLVPTSDGKIEHIPSGSCALRTSK